MSAIQDLLKKYNASSGSSGNNSNIQKYEQNERSYRNGCEAAKDLSKSSLFNRDIVDGAHKITDALKNDQWAVDMDIDGDGTLEDGVSIADAIALSCDSELDLYIQKQLEDVIRDSGCKNLRDLFGQSDSAALVALAKKGIRATAVGDDSNWQNRTYAFSLVKIPDAVMEKVAKADELAAKKAAGEQLTAEEEALIKESELEVLNAVNDPNAEVITDEFGKKGSFIFSDCLIPDGVANGAEINLSSILDTMGYECISKADFIDNEDSYHQLMQTIEERLANMTDENLDGQNYYSTNGTVETIYGSKTLDISTAVRAVYTANADAPGQWGFNRSFEDNLKLIEKMGLGYAGNGGKVWSSMTPAEQQKALEKQMEEIEDILKNKSTEYTQLYNEILDEKVSDYKSRNNNEEPPAEKYSQFIDEAMQEANKEIEK